MDPKHLTSLRVHDACQGLSADEIDAIYAHVDVVEVNAGETFHTAGQEIDALYIVVKGRLRMAIALPDGRQRTIRYISAGDQFGALMLVTDEEFPLDVIVDESATLLRIEEKLAEQLAQQFPIFRRNLLRKIGFDVRDSMLGARRKRSISKVVAFVQVDDETRKLVTEIASRLSAIGEKIGILTDSQDVAADQSGIRFQSIRGQDGGLVGPSEIRQTVSQWSDLQRIFLVTDRNHPPEHLAHLIELSDKLFCVSKTDDFHSVVEEIQALIQVSPSWKKKIHFVWASPPDQPIVPVVPELPMLAQRDFKLQLSAHGSDSRLFDQGIDRIVHYLRDVSIGLALSGGAAHGMTHLGVLKALEEAGITVDRIAGTSAGVLTGVLYCAGRSPEWDIKTFARDLEPGSMFKWFPKGDGFYMLEKYRSHSWDRMLRKYLADSRLEQLPIPVNTVTTDLISADSVVRSSGDAVDSILESINLPVLAPPICRDGMLLVDGGILDNLPADVLMNQGCNFVIGVDVAANIEKRVGNNDSSTPADKMKAPGIVTTLLRCLKVQAHSTSASRAETADIIIAPDVSGFDSTAFTQAPEMAEVGYQTTMVSLPRIREILHNLDSDLFGS